MGSRKSDAGKGDRQRPTNYKAYSENYDRVFRKSEELKTELDIDRIDRISSYLHIYWHRYPELRFGQLLSCFLSTNNDIFYLDDSVLEERVKRSLQENQ